MQELDLSANDFELCLKCNLCTTVCPMLAVNPHYPGPKQAGPDGERYRLKDPEFYDLTLKYCLNCKRCEVACPSDVRVGDIIQSARLSFARSSAPLRDHLLADTDFVGKLATPFAPVVNSVLGWEPVRKVLDSVFAVDRRRVFPSYARERFSSWFRRTARPMQEAFSRKVAYFHGCYVEYNYPQLGKDLVKLANAAGYGVELLEDERCCGVAMLSNGFSDKARKSAQTNIAAIRKALSGGAEAVLTTGSTCTLTMREEYANVLGMDVSDIVDGIQLATKWLYERLEEGTVALNFRSPLKPLKLAYHSACHMVKLGWSIFSTEMLRKIPGVELTVLDPKCCGIAGTFGFKKENYDYSQKIGQPLFDEILSAAPDIVVTDCETCKWQIEMSTGLSVQNPVSILAQAVSE